MTGSCPHFKNSFPTLCAALTFSVGCVEQRFWNVHQSEICHVLSPAEMNSISKSSMPLWSFMNSQISTWFRLLGKTTSPQDATSSGLLHNNQIYKILMAFCYSLLLQSLYLQILKVRLSFKFVLIECFLKWKWDWGCGWLLSCVSLQTVPVELSATWWSSEDRPHDGGICSALLSVQPWCFPVHR